MADIQSFHAQLEAGVVVPEVVAHELAVPAVYAGIGLQTEEER